MSLSYSEGMFAHSPEPISDGEALMFGERIAYHEAGHAVVGYALGLGCTRIQMRETYFPLERQKAPSGCYYITREAARNSTTLIQRGKYHPTLARIAIMSAAGPAAELKYCQENELPARILGGSESDHRSIEAIGKRISNCDGRSRHAFEELAWRGACRMLNRPEIWNAVYELSQALFDLFSELYEDETPHQHSVFETLPGSQARAIMHRCGIHPARVS